MRLYGRQEVIAAITRAREYQTYDAAYVETILLQERRRRDLPSPNSTVCKNTVPSGPVVRTIRLAGFHCGSRQR